jgi:hypothetical protein
VGAGRERRIVKKLFLVMAVVAMVLAAAGTAAAQSGCQRGVECGEQDYQVVPTGDPTDWIYV